MERSFQAWCAAVTDCVRFKPDRAEIARELGAHYEDHVRDLERVGYDRALAEERAQGAMGDPETVGRAMDAAHRPLLGWLWRVSRWMVILVLALVLLCLPGADWSHWWDWAAFSEREADQDPLRNAVMLSPPASFSAGVYDFTVDRAGYVTGEDGSRWLWLEVTCTTPCFWLEGPDLTDTLTAVDSRGVEYLPWRFPRVSGFKDYGSRGLSRGFIQVDAIEGDPTWIELHHPLGGWSFRVNLTEGGGP